MNKEFDNNLVSILIPTYNSMPFIEKTLKSCIEQEYINIEILIADDCSHDETYEFLNNFCKKDSRMRIIKNTFNIGIANNFNKLIDEAKGDFVKFLGHDDVMCKNFIGQAIEELSIHGFKNNFFVSQELSPTTNRLKLIKKNLNKSRLDRDRLFKTLINWGNWIGGPSAILVSKELLENLKFDPNYRSTFDYDFYLRLSFKYGLVISDKPLYTVGIHENQASRIYENGEFSKEIVRILSKSENRYRDNSTLIYIKIMQNLFELLYLKCKIVCYLVVKLLFLSR